MKFRFASWNVNSRTVTAAHLDRLREVDADILALQEASARFHASLVGACLFGWSTSSLALRPFRYDEGRSRRGSSATSLNRRIRFPFRGEDESVVYRTRFPGHS